MISRADKISIALLAIFAVITSRTQADAGSVPVVSVKTVEKWAEELSNWGRWGKDDELGTLNLITPEKRVQAAALVQDGETVSVSRPVSKGEDPLSGLVSFRHKVSTLAHGGGDFALDRYDIEYHGWTHSHIDSLAHMFWKGRMYNGYTAQEVIPSDSALSDKEVGAHKLGVEVMHKGIVSRAVLVDVPSLKGVDYLEPGTAVTSDDLDAWENKTGVMVGEGDILLLRVGLLAYHQATGDISNPKRSGFHVSAVEWLKKRGVAVLGCDANSDVIPSGVAGFDHPVHMLLLNSLGMPIMDNLDLSRIAQVAAQKERWDFMMVIAPLAIPGGTGSPVNALAVF